MNFLQDLYIMEVMHTITQALLIPVVLCLMAIIVYSLFSVGNAIVEYVMERRHFRAYVPELIARLASAPISELANIIDESKLLRGQKDDLDELVTYFYLPEDARVSVARRLLANEESAYKRQIGRTNVIAVIGTMLGLMGTLISMGPGMEGLGGGDLETLSTAVSVAFDTSVAGMAASVVCFVLSYIRGSWYEDYLVSMETLFTTLLERAESAHAEGHEFPQELIVFEKGGKRARRVSIASDTLQAKVDAVKGVSAGAGSGAGAANAAQGGGAYEVA